MSTVIDKPNSSRNESDDSVPGTIQPLVDFAARPRANVTALCAILVCGLCARAALWWAWNGQPIQIVDAQDYHRLAVGLVETGSYLTPDGQPSSLRPPLYPWIVSQIYQVFGVENDAAVRAFQALLSLVTVLIVYRLGLLMYSDKVGLLAAVLACFYPSLLGFNNLILSETLFTFLVVCSTWLVVEGLHRNTVAWMIPAGAVFGLGALTRSILLLSIPFLAVFLLFAWRGGWFKKLSAAALLVAAFAATIAPWVVRNTQVQQVFTLIDVMGGRNAMMGNYEHTPLERSWATISIVTGEKSWDNVLRQAHPEVIGMTQGQLDKAAMKYGIRFVLANPVLTAKRVAVRFFNFWQLERTLVAGAQQGLWGHVPKPLLLSLAAVICGGYAFVIFLGIFGLILAPARNRRYHWLLIVSIAIPCLVHSAIFAHSRYHLPLMPLVMLFAAAALMQRKEIWRHREKWGFKLAILCCVVLMLGWARELVFVDLAHASQMIP